MRFGRGMSWQKIQDTGRICALAARTFSSASEIICTVCECKWLKISLCSHSETAWRAQAACGMLWYDLPICFWRLFPSSQLFVVGGEVRALVVFQVGMLDFTDERYMNWLWLLRLFVDILQWQVSSSGSASFYTSLSGFGSVTREWHNSFVSLFCCIGSGNS